MDPGARPAAIERIAALLVGHPLRVLGIAALFAAAWLLARTFRTSRGRPARLLVPAAAWALYAAWEGFVQAATPEANLRVDLLLIWPALLLLSTLFPILAFRGAAARGSGEAP